PRVLPLDPMNGKQIRVCSPAPRVQACRTAAAAGIGDGESGHTTKHLRYRSALPLHNLLVIDNSRRNTEHAERRFHLRRCDNDVLGTWSDIENNFQGVRWNLYSGCI